MITWIQRFFLKHNKWLFGSLLVVIVVTFVLTIGPQSFFDGSSARQQTKLSFFGYDLASPADQQRIMNGAEVSAMLNPELQLRSNQLSDYAYIRVAGLGVAHQMGIPKPTKEQLAEFVRGKTIFMDRETGVFSAEVYNQMLDILSNSDRFDKKTLARVLEEDYRITAVREAMSGPFYILPKEIEAEYVETKSVYDFSILRRSFVEFETELAIETADAQAYYDENPARYETPEKLRATAIVFNANSYLDEVTEIADEQIELYFNRNQSKYQPAPVEGVEVEAVALEAVRDQVLADVRLEQARKIAEKKTEAFALALWEREIKRSDPQFEQLVNELGGTELSIPPYSRTAAPSFPNISRQLLNSLWTYTAGRRYFSEIGQNKDGAVVLAIDEVIPTNIPSFEAISDQVIKDFRNEERVRLFIAEGPIVKEELIAALASTESSEAAASEVGLTHEAVEPFEGLNIPSSFRQNNLWQQSRYLENNQVTDMIFTGIDGIFVVADSIERPELDRGSDDFKAFADEEKALGNAGIGWTRLSEISANALKSLGLN